MPPLLAINANVNNEENYKFWVDSRGDTFLQPSIEIRGEIEGVDDAESVVYELRVCFLFLSESICYS